MTTIQEPGAPLPDAIKGQIRWLVAKYHVGTPDETIKADMIKRLKGDVDAKARKQVVAFALKQHHKNQRLYCRVMSGSI
jgi:hypothetical protein